MLAELDGVSGIGIGSCAGNALLAYAQKVLFRPTIYLFRPRI